jgi:hypothetical protein
LWILHRRTAIYPQEPWYYCVGKAPRFCTVQRW